MDPKDQALLASLGRQGWNVLSKNPSTEYTSGTYPGERIPKYPEGSEVWVITDGKGHNQTMVVKPPSAYPGPYSPNANDPGAFNPNPTIIDPPKDVPPPSANAGWTDITDIRNPDGSSTKYGRNPATGKFERLPNVPNSAAPQSTTPRPSPSNQLETIKDPTTGKPIKLRDPATGATIDLDPAAKPDKAQIVDGPRGAKYSWDGTTLKEVMAGEAAPKEGDAFEAVEGGRKVTKTFRGGQWVTTAVGDSVIPGQAKEGDSYEAVEDGRRVTKTYRGGQWVTTSVGASAIPGAAKEGDTYEAVEGGRNVTKTYRGGQWVTTKVGTSAVAEPPRAIAAPINQPNIAREDPVTGEITYVPNQNYQPADVAGQVQQLQALAKKERDRINALPDQSEAEKSILFESWWQENVEPRKQQIAQAQAEITRKQQTEADTTRRQGILDESTYERQRQADARQAGRDAVADVNATLPYRVGPGFGANFAAGLKTLSSGGGAVHFDANDFTFDMPDTKTIAEQATAHALAGISSYAAMKIGQPPPMVPQGMDISSMLNPGQYQFAKPAGTTVTLPDGTRIESSNNTPDPMIGNDRRHLPTGIGTPITAPTAPTDMNALIRGF